MPAAEQLMIYQGERMLFVVTDLPSIEGLITSSDLRGEKPMRVAHDRNVHCDEQSVADMTDYAQSSCRHRKLRSVGADLYTAGLGTG